MEGNQIKMREALKELVGVIDECAINLPLWWHNGAKGVMPLKNAKAALALPPRNCDVGTVEEQNNRMDVYCQTRKCESCPLWDNANNGVRCEFTWAQMPYEAEEGVAK